MGCHLGSMCHTRAFAARGGDTHRPFATGFLEWTVHNSSLVGRVYQIKVTRLEKGEVNAPSDFGYACSVNSPRPIIGINKGG